MIFPDWRGVKLVAALMQGTHWMLVMRSGLAKRGEIEAVKRAVESPPIEGRISSLSICFANQV